MVWIYLPGCWQLGHMPETICPCSHPQTSKWRSGESSVVVFKIPGVFRDFCTTLKLLQRGKNYMEGSLTALHPFWLLDLWFQFSSQETILNSVSQPNYIDYVKSLNLLARFFWLHTGPSYSFENQVVNVPFMFCDDLCLVSVTCISISL